jgi:FtsZ-binding cell division protein ZapB
MLDKSKGYSQLMSQVGYLQIIFQHFEKYVMTQHSTKTIRLLQIELLKKKLSKQVYSEMMSDLMNSIERYRKGEHINLEYAHNLALLLIDVDEYKKFEQRLKKETSTYFKAKANPFFDHINL